MMRMVRLMRRRGDRYLPGEESSEREGIASGDPLDNEM